MRHYSSKEIREFVLSPIYDESSVLNSDPSWPKISIVVPSYNQSVFLERTLISILNQNYPNMELIVIDGGSNDGSQDIINRYDKYIDYWISEKDKGQSDALNKGFAKTSGEIIAWLNSDDIYLPGTLRRVGSEVMSRPRVDVFYGNEYIIDEDDQIIKERRVTSGLPIFSMLGFLAGNFGYYQPASFWKKELYLKVGGVDSSFRFTMDNDLFAKFDLAGAKYCFIKQFLSGFRLHSGSKTTNMQDIAAGELKHIYEKYNMPKPVSSFVRMNLLRLIKSLLYIKQGDGLWLAKNIINHYLCGIKFNY